MTRHFYIFWVIILTATFARAGRWCLSQSQGLDCSFDDYECVCRKGRQEIGRIRPSHGAELTWVISCQTGALPELTQSRLSLGHIEHLEFERCGLGDSRLRDFFLAMNVDGLVHLKIDLEDDRRRRPLLNDSFVGLEDFSSLRRLSLERISDVASGLLLPLLGLRELSIRNWKNFNGFPKSFLDGLTSLEYLEIYELPQLTSLPDHFFQRNIELKVVNLSTNGLQLLQSNLFESLVNLEELVLNRNFITTIPSDLFKNNYNMKILWWKEDYCSTTVPCDRTFPKSFFESNQKITTFIYSAKSGGKGKIDKSFFECKFPKSLQQLSIEGVKNMKIDQIIERLEDPAGLKSFSVYNCNFTIGDEILSHLNGNIEIDVRKNRIACDQCKILNLPNVKIDHCYDLNQSRLLSNETVKQQLLKQYCNVKQHYVVAGAVAVAVVFTLVAVALVTLISERVRVRLYHNRFFGNLFVPETDFEAKKYDAFISYAEVDEDLATKIATNLEGKIAAGDNETRFRTFKCCLHHRDWTAGQEIFQNIVESVENSRRTVIILSRHFLSSPFCLQEFSQAYSQNRVLVVMRVNDVTKRVDVESADLQDPKFELIRRYLQTFTYLREDDSDFWRKLVYRLPHKRMTHLPSNVVKSGASLQRRISELRRLISRDSREDNDTDDAFSCQP